MQPLHALLKASDFAKLCHVNKKTLHYYDQIGLFKPFFTNEHGYRYYSYQQYETFFLISSLKEMGMSLDEIKQFLSNRSNEQFLATLIQQKQKLDQHIQTLTQTSLRLSNMISLTQHTNEIDFNLISIEELSAEHLILSHPLQTTSDHEVFTTLSEHINYCERYNLQDNYIVGTILSYEKLMQSDFSAFSYFFIKTNQLLDDHAYFIRPAGLYVCGYHLGDYTTLYETYQKMFHYLASHHYDIIGDSYEETLLNFFSSTNSTEYVTKLIIPIRKRT